MPPPPFFSSGFAGALLALTGFAPPNEPPLEPLELPEPPLLEPPNDDPLLAGRLVGLLELLLGADGEGVLLAGRLPKGDEPLEPPELPDPPLPEPPNEPPVLAGRLPPPNVPPEPPPLGDEGVLLAGRLPPLLNGEVLPLEVLGGVEPPGRLVGLLDGEPNPPGRAAGVAPPPGVGLVRAPEPGKLEVDRLPKLLELELPKGFTRDDEADEPLSSSSSAPASSSSSISSSSSSNWS